MTKRNTIQRSLVFEAVNKLQCHATADEIYEAIVTEHPNVSRATVYRNLKLLSEIGYIRKIEIPGGADRFDHLCHDHCHVKCEKCGRVFDVDMEYITGLEKSIKDDRGFTFTGYDILFRGVCPDCQESPKQHNC
ncbi:MAG: transcriptional repressor [Firmicutes bacterium]|nr:transcriptional repressor [Bacillota bacterium]